MISKDLLDILCCPETHQALDLAGPAQIEQINQRIARGEARTRGGTVVQETIDGGLVRADKKFLYPIRKDIPILLIDQALPLDTVP